MWKTCSVIFGIVLVVSLLPTLVIGTPVLGLWQARRARDRVETIRSPREMTGGDLEARVPGMDAAPDDIADIGRAVNRMAAAQAASVASLKQVSADIAHDLKTPIQRIAVLLSQLEDAGLDPAGRHRRPRPAGDRQYRQDVPVTSADRPDRGRPRRGAVRPGRSGRGGGRHRRRVRTDGRRGRP